MKLYYCKKCKEYSKTAVARATMNTRVEINDTGEYLDSDSDVAYGNTLLKVEARHCAECDWPLVIEELEYCPHDWRVDLFRPSLRRCKLCNRIERGKVSFD